jgi:hypothetical protein
MIDSQSEQVISFAQASNESAVDAGRRFTSVASIAGQRTVVAGLSWRRSRSAAADAPAGKPCSGSTHGFRLRRGPRQIPVHKSAIERLHSACGIPKRPVASWPNKVRDE